MLFRGFYWLSGHKLILEKFQITKGGRSLTSSFILNIDVKQEQDMDEDDIEKQIADSGILLGQPSAVMLQAAQKIREEFRNGQPVRPLRVR